MNPRPVKTYWPLSEVTEQDSCAHALVRLIASKAGVMTAKFILALRYLRSLPLSISLRMPTGPKGQKRPAHVNARAVMIAKIATGEIEDITTDEGKNAAAAALGHMGG